MTEPTPKKTAGEPSSPLQRKYAGLPLWIYLVAVGLLVFLVIYYRRKQAAAASSTDTTSSSTTDNTASANTVPPFINQVYVSEEPPEASSIPKPPVAKPPPPKPSEKTHKLVGTYYWKNLSAALAHAKVAHISEAELKKLNPELFKKYGNNHKKIPKGTVVRYA